MKRAARRKIGRDERDDDEQPGERCQNRQAHRNNSKNKRGHRLADSERNRQANGQPNATNKKRMAQDELEHIAWIGAEGKTDAEFVSSMRDVFRQNSVDA